MEFSKTELWLILYALEHEISELNKIIEWENEDYKNDKGEWGISHKERDKFLYEHTTKLFEKIKREIAK